MSVIDTLVMNISGGTVATSKIGRLHVTQNLRETRSIPSNTLSRIPEGQFLPGVVVNLLSIHIYQVLLARSACVRTKMSLAEHGIFLVSTSLSVQKLHNLLDFLGQLSESLHHIVLVGKLVEDLLDHVPKFI